jgi:hypothetical protein
MTVNIPRSRNVDLADLLTIRAHLLNYQHFDGSTSWTDFKSHFEVCSELNGWSQNEKGMYLAVPLRGNAQGVLGNLPSYEQRDFLLLCKALEQR